MDKFKFALEGRLLGTHCEHLAVRVTPEFTGDEENPLALSIEKWEFIVEILRGQPGIRINCGGVDTCALCAKYKTSFECTGCPVQENTGHHGCDESPYREWHAHHSLATAQAELEFLRGLTDTQDDEYQITIDGETYTIHKMVNRGYLVQLICESPDGPTFYVARDSEAAGEAAKKYYLDLLEQDPHEFVCLVGTKNLIYWGMGRWAGCARNLDDWLDEIASYPEQRWGAHDGTEYEIDQVSQSIVDDLGYTPSVAYRCG